MKTTIIPQLKSIIITSEQTLSIADFKFCDCIKAALPIWHEILPLDGNKIIRRETTAMEAEHYRINVRANGMVITTGEGDDRALMYALFTLSELERANDGVLTECDIEDGPALKLRGLSDDISRGQISTTADFFAIIRKLARYKYNTYMPYMEDVFKFDSFPAWGRYSEPITKDEWRRLIAYAKTYHMDIRPIVNLLGHFNKLCYIDEFQPLALRNGDAVTACMDPKNPAVREHIVKILDEIIEVFGVGRIHVGGDEPVDLTTVFGHDEGGSLFIKHYTFVAEELRKRNCKCMLYADFFAPPWGDYAAPVDRARELPSDVEFVFWDYAARPAYPFVSALHDNGLKMYISPGSWTWKRFACDFKTCYSNVKGLLKADNGRSLGMIMSSWADGGDTLRELTWPGVVVGGNYCWSPNSTYTYQEMYDLYHQSFFGISSEDAAKMDNLYHYDYLISRKDQHEMKNTMFADPALMIAFEDKEHIYAVEAAMDKAEADVATITVTRNQDAYDAMLFALSRIRYTAHKIAWLPWEKPNTIEQAIPYAAKAKQLAEELLPIKEKHHELWFRNNRQSEWDICEARYDDEYDRLNILARNMSLRKYFMDRL